MAFAPVVLWYDSLGGQSNQPMGKLRQDQLMVEMTQASNVIPDPIGKLVTSPGFSAVRSTAISGAPAITGIYYLGDRANETILTSSDGKINRNNANPPAAIVGGTDFTTGATVLSRFGMGGAAGSEVVVVVTTSRDKPQQITVSTMAKVDLGGTPPRGVDFKVWGRRPFMFSPSDGTTTYSSFASFGDTDDNMASWVNPYTTNFLSFGRPGMEVNVLGGEIYKDHLFAFTEKHLFPLYRTPNATLPFAFQDSIFSEEGGGPPNIHSVVVANERIYWISKNFDVKVMTADRVVHSVGYAIQPYLRGLNDSYRVYTYGSYLPTYRCVCWMVYNGSNTQAKDLILMHVDTGQFFFRTLQRNCLALMTVGGQMRLVGGDYAGLFYNEFDSTKTGDLQTAGSAIDADVMTPPHHLGLPGVTKKIPFIAVELSPIGSEKVTFQYDLDDSNTWTSFSESPYTVSGTNVVTAYLTIPAPFKTIRLRFRDNNSGERYRVMRYGFPKPTAVQTQR